MGLLRNPSFHYSCFFKLCIPEKRSNHRLTFILRIRDDLDNFKVFSVSLSWRIGLFKTAFDEGFNSLAGREVVSLDGNKCFL
jgi:hypothetical protein